MAENEVVVRVAPSPTGPPHVGTGYIALFNLALRRLRGGRFILRIEDTDRARSTAESEEQIFEALRWLGLLPDESPLDGGPRGPYRQSERSGLYTRYACELLEKGRAYRCFCTPERLAALRKDPKATAGPLLGYDGHCRDLPPEEVEQRLKAGESHVVRLRVDPGDSVEVEDLFRKTITIDRAQVDDQVLIKSDGFPTYHLANVVDDHLMGVTHVIRAEEWIPSLPKHVILYEAFGWAPPVFAHMPLLRNKDRSKISKRKNPTSLLWYRDAGYLPEAMVNFLALLGYSPPPRELAEGENPEIFTLEEMVRDFDLGRVKTSGPIFDLEKLDSFNGSYIRAMDPNQCVDRLLAFYAFLEEREPILLEEARAPLPAKGDLRERQEKKNQTIRDSLAFWRAERPTAEQLAPLMKVAQERIVTFLDFSRVVAFFFAREVNPDKALLVPKKAEPAGTAALFREVAGRLSGLSAFDVASIEEAVRKMPEELSWKVRPLFMALRVAVTGSKVSPPLFESMEILGKDKTLARLERAAERLSV